MFALSNFTLLMSSICTCLEIVMLFDHISRGEVELRCLADLYFIFPSIVFLVVMLRILGFFGRWAIVYLAQMKPLIVPILNEEE